jgi:hypothetical protein
VNDGERFTAARVHRRQRRHVRQPTTRGLFDTATGVYWAADSFACPVTHEITDIDELGPNFYREASS